MSGEVSHEVPRGTKATGTTTHAANTAPAMMRRANSAGSGCTSPAGPNQSRLATHSTSPASTTQAQRTRRIRAVRLPMPLSSTSAASMPTANHEA
jgi:hypothetical protein